MQGPGVNVEVIYAFNSYNATFNVWHTTFKPLISDQWNFP